MKEDTIRFTFTNGFIDLLWHLIVSAVIVSAAILNDPYFLAAATSLWVVSLVMAVMAKNFHRLVLDGTVLSKMPMALSIHFLKKIYRPTWFKQVTLLPLCFALGSLIVYGYWVLGVAWFVTLTMHDYYIQDLKERREAAEKKT